jgi:prepilin-type N-terminal cleavage/methylation domain-containing protein
MNTQYSKAKQKPEAHVSQNRGFTLLETLVAILILTLAMAPGLLIASRTLIISNVAREQVTAIYLAQEALEAVRSVRDNNALTGTADWLNGLRTYVDGNAFRVDMVAVAGSVTITSCGGGAGACPVLNYNSASRLYQYVSGSASEFRRSVEIDSIPGTADQVRVIATISWTMGPFTRTFTASDYLYNWQ